MLAQAKSMCRTINTTLALACAPVLIDIPTHGLIYLCRRATMACERRCCCYCLKGTHSDPGIIPE